MEEFIKITFIYHWRKRKMIWKSTSYRIADFVLMGMDHTVKHAGKLLHGKDYMSLKLINNEAILEGVLIEVGRPHEDTNRHYDVDYSNAVFEYDGISRRVTVSEEQAKELALYIFKPLRLFVHVDINEYNYKFTMRGFEVNENN